MKIKNKVLICVALLVAITAIALTIGLQYLKFAMGMGFINPIIFESTSPYQMGKALFVTQGLQDRGIFLYINDFNARHKYIDVGTIYWSNTKAVKATWSKDGSIIACENEIGNNLYISYVYDFLNDSLFYPPGISSCSADFNLSDEAWNKHSRKMKLLIEERGGKSEAIDLSKVYGNGRSPSVKEWKDMMKLYR